MYTTSGIFSNVMFETNEYHSLKDTDKLRDVFYSNAEFEKINDVACPSGTFSKNTQEVEIRTCSTCPVGYFAGKYTCLPCNNIEMGRCSEFTGHRRMKQQCSFFDDDECILCSDATGCPYNTSQDIKYMCGNSVLDLYAEEYCDIGVDACCSQNCTVDICNS
jgi:hypothetical protein